MQLYKTILIPLIFLFVEVDNKHYRLLCFSDSRGRSLTYGNANVATREAVGNKAKA